MLRMSCIVRTESLTSPLHSVAVGQYCPVDNPRESLWEFSTSPTRPHEREVEQDGNGCRHGREPGRPWRPSGREAQLTVARLGARVQISEAAHYGTCDALHAGFTGHAALVLRRSEAR
jgi:hypothetical protein